MADVQYYMAVEPGLAGSHWFRQCIQGIRQEVSKSKGSLVEIQLDDMSSLEKPLAQERPLVLLAGSLLSWTLDAAYTLESKGIHCILLTAQMPNEHLDVSTVSMDYSHAIASLFGYLTKQKHTKPALFGVHPDSMHDQTKKQAYERVMQQLPNAKPGIFLNMGDITTACESFFCQRQDYDAVICTNDIIAIKLQGYLREHGVCIPEELCLVGIGETRLAQMIHPRIPTVSLQYMEIGHHAVRLYNLLRRNDTISSLHAKVQGKVMMGEMLCPAESFPVIAKTLHPTQRDFFSDADVQQICLLEAVLSRCLPMDIQILRGMLDGASMKQLAEAQYTSENAIRYRMRRMMELAQCSSREDLLQLVLTQLRREDLDRQIL